MQIQESFISLNSKATHMATFKPFKHQTVELKRKGNNLISVSIEVKRHTGKIHTYGLAVQANGRKVTEDQYSLYWEVRDILEKKGFDFSEIYY